MRLPGVVGLSALISISVFGSPGLARDDWGDFRSMMGAYDDTVAISERLALYLSEKSTEDLGNLAEDVRRNLGERYLRLVHDGFGFAPEPSQSEIEHFDALVAHVAGLSVFSDDQTTRVAMESLGPCETAGILVRNLALQVSEGAKEYRVENGRIFIDGTNNDQRYAKALVRCQIVKRHKLTPAVVGYSRTACQASRQPECPEIIDQ